MNKKTERKNKTKQNVTWPKLPYFTVEELQALNNNFVPITLRVRLTKEIEKGLIVCIGSKTGGQGRPKKVFSFTPVIQTTRDLARSQNITPPDDVRHQTMVGKSPIFTNIVSPAAVIA